MWIRLYKDTDSTRGTLKHMRNILNRSAVGKDPSKNVHAIEDLLEVVLAAYVLQATCIVLDVSVDDGLQDKSPLQ
jgi:hypothetical protein